MPNRNHRRRLMAFLGLMGAPAALWAVAVHAQTTAASSSSASSPMTWPQSVECTGLEQTPTYALMFKNSYVIDGGKLTGDNEPLISIEALPTQALYGAGFQDATKSDNDTFNGFGSVLELGDGEYGGIDGEFHTRIRVPAAVTSGRVLNAATGQVLVSSLTLNADSSDASVYDVQGMFTADDGALLQGPVTITLELDGKTAATLTYDLSQIDTPSFADRMQAKYTALTGVSSDGTFVYGADDCSVPVDDGMGGAGCFFTTAAVETLGLSDDCWELRTLRRFRDGPLAKTPAGLALTARYYAEAPRLVAGINRRGDADLVWLKTYWSHVLPCAVMARLGWNDLAIAHYRRLFVRLERLAVA